MKLFALPQKTNRTSISRVFEWLNTSGSTRPLGIFRIVLVFLLWSRYAADLSLWKSIDSTATVLTGIAFFILTPLALLGIETRRVMALLAGVVALTYFHLGHGLGYTPFTHHHTYLLMACTALCALGPCGQSFSLDRYLTVQRGKVAAEHGPLIANHLIRLQLAAVYLWTAVDKTNLAFLNGIRLEQILWFHYQDTILQPLLEWTALMTLVSIAVVLIEYFLSIAILFRRWLTLVFGLGLLLHGTFYWMLPVSTFSVTMLAMYIFLPKPDTIHRSIDWSVMPSKKT